MPTRRPPSDPPRSGLRLPRPAVLMLVALVLAFTAPMIQAQTAPVVQPTVAPPPPTAPPPPPPTAVPPTAVPPTAVPPTAVPPTEVPATEVPSTEVPTEQPPTATVPAPPPTSPPQNPQPVQPQQPRPVATTTIDTTQVTCHPAPEAPRLVPGADDWTLYACTLPLDLGPLDSLTLVGTPTTPGWQVILVEEDAPDTPGLLNASNNRLELRDLAGKREAEFLLGARLGCTALPATTVSFAITGTRPESDAQVKAEATLDLATTIDPPTLAITEFTDRALTIAYTDAVATCGWQLLVTLDGVTDIPTVTGVEISTDGTGTSDITGRAAPIPGAISILVPAGPATGTVTISTSADPDALIVEAFPAP